MSEVIDLPDRYQREREPELATCAGCGRQWRWEWYAPHEGLHPGRWCYPKLNPCPECTPPPDEAREKAIRARMRAAGLPEPLLGFDLHRTTIQRQGEEVEPFQTRARREGLLGVSPSTAGALGKVRNWKPPRWLVLHGPPGRGKTTLLAAIGRRLCVPPPERMEVTPGAQRLPLPGQRTLVRGRVQRVTYERTDELVRREAIKLRSIDPHPTVDAAKVEGVLLLDELGLAESIPEPELRLIERILCYRHDYGLCTVIATNRSYQELTEGALYGWRVADRLRTALDVAVGGPSWRGL